MNEDYFNTFFGLIASVACDKAKEHVEKRKGVGNPKLQYLLTEVALGEKYYYSLSFLEPKWFIRKITLRQHYQATSNGFHNLLKDVAIGDEEETGNSALLKEVIEGLEHFCICRIECIDLYTTSMNPPPFEELEKSLGALVQTAELKLQSAAVLKPLLDSFVSEFSTYQHLVQASILIAEWNFFASLMELHKIHRTLETWQPLLAKVQHHTYSFRSGFFGFGEKHSSSLVSALYQWMAKYFRALVAKFSLYFYEILSRQGRGEDMKAFLAKTSFDFISKMHAFCKKYDPCYIMLGAIGNENTSKLIDHAQKANHAKILELPYRLPDYIWLSIDAFLYNKSEEIETGRVVFLHDKQIDVSFFAAQSDLGINFVIAVAGKKSEKDTHIVNFIDETIKHLDIKSLFPLLKPGTK